MTERRLYLNGIDGATGEYLVPPLSPEDVMKVARGFNLDPKLLAQLKWRRRQATQPVYEIIEGADETRLEQAGWGVICAEGADPGIRDALSPLLEHRKQQASTINPQRYHEYMGADAYRAGESKLDFIKRFSMGPGPVDPDRMPYYLLIVGDPEEIPFSFQYELDVQFSVGRIHFDTLDEYAQYARAVVQAEQESARRPRRAVFFGTRNNHDVATQLSADLLVSPLAQHLADTFATATPPAAPWTVETIRPADATKARLTELLGGADTPALLFTASHGMGYPSSSPDQLARQGALICQDWPGPAIWSGPITRELFFAAEDVAANAQLQGLITFSFACFGAGTPRLDDFSGLVENEDAREIAPRDFLAALPRRLLSGGALAVVSHVDRAWSHSFDWDDAGAQLAVFTSAFRRLMEGKPVGFAMEYFNTRHAEISVSLLGQMEGVRRGRAIDELEVAFLWTTNNDARNLVIIGDPAVRLNV